MAIDVKTVLRLVAAVLMTACVPAVTSAQVFIGAAKPRPGSVEISGGGLLAGGQDLPDQAATLTPNPSTGSSSFELFNANPSLGAGFGAQGMVTVYLTRALAVEGGLQFSRPQLKVELSDDVEDAPDVTASTTITEYVFTGSLVYHFWGSGRTVPFVAGGAGHLRDAHSGNGVVETGIEYHATGGVKMWFPDSRQARRFGLRAEAGLSVRDGGFSFDEDRRMVPFAAVSFLYLF
jgi:hypothetical protein